MSQVYLLMISESTNPLALGRRRHTAVFATKELAVLDRDKYFRARCGYLSPERESDDQNHAVAIRRDYYWKNGKKLEGIETFITAEISCHGIVENKENILSYWEKQCMNYKPNMEVSNENRNKRG